MPIRVVALGDAPGLAGLSRQLGYGPSRSSVLGHLRTIATRDDIMVFVFEEAGQSIAWIELTERRAIESGRWGEITGLVVDESHRGRGIGRQLVRFAREWARERSLPRLRVRTNETRHEARRFYERQGFTLTKTQRVYDITP